MTALDVGPYLLPLEAMPATAAMPPLQPATAVFATAPSSIGDRTWASLIEQSDPFVGTVDYVFRAATLSTQGGGDSIGWAVRETTRVTLARDPDGTQTTTFLPPVTLSLGGHSHVHALVSSIRATTKLTTVTMRSSVGAHTPWFSKRFLRAIIRTLTVTEKNAALVGVPFVGLRASTPANAGAALVSATSLGAGVRLHARALHLSFAYPPNRSTLDLALSGAQDLVARGTLTDSLAALNVDVTGLSGTLSQGKLASGGIIGTLNSATLRVASLSLSHSQSTGAAATLKGVSIDGDLSSLVARHEGGDESYVVTFPNHSHISIPNLDVTFSDGAPPRLSILSAATSGLSSDLASAELKIGPSLLTAQLKNLTVGLKSGSALGEGPPLLANAAIDSATVAGSLELFPGAAFDVTGEVKHATLQLDGARRSPLFGTVGSLNLALAAQSHVEFGSVAQRLLFPEGATLTSVATPPAASAIGSGRSMLSGAFSLKAPVAVSREGVSLRKWAARVSIADDGSATADTCPNGTPANEPTTIPLWDGGPQAVLTPCIVFHSQGNALTVSVGVHLDPFSRPHSFLTGPHTDADNEEARYFSFKFDAALSLGAPFDQTFPADMSSPGSYTFHVRVPTTFTLTVPGGAGQYKNPDNPAEGTGHDEGDAMDHWQEVYTDSFSEGVGHCRIHAFVAPWAPTVLLPLQVDIAAQGGGSHTSVGFDVASAATTIGRPNGDYRGCSLRPDAKIFAQSYVINRYVPNTILRTLGTWSIGH